MSFLKFTWRELVSSNTFNWFYILCATLGIIGLLLVESFKGGIEEKISKNAKNFIASDLAISSRRIIEPIEKQKIENYLAKSNLTFARWIETYSLVSNISVQSPIAKLAEINFVSNEFPYYGGVTLGNNEFKGPGNWELLHSAPIAWIGRDLAWNLNLKNGDSIKIGEMIFIIKGIIVDDKFSSFRGFNLAPKIFISHKYLAQTQLIKFGSTATYTYALKIPSEVNTLEVQKELRSLIPDKSIKILGPEESSQQVARSLNILSDYLALITLITYLLSLVGLYYFTQHFLSLKLKTLSIYKALGIKTTFLFKVNFTHLFLLTIFSILISTLLILTSLPLVESFFSHLIGETLTFKLSLSAIIRIFLISSVGSMLALGPLFWGALQTSIARIFQDLPAETKRIKFIYFIPLVLYTFALTIFLANSIKLGTYFLCSITIIIVLAAIIFKFFTVVIEKISLNASFTNRHAALAISRYFSSSFTIFISLFIGMIFTVFIFQLESSLRQEFTQTYGDRRPDLFMFDLQDSQSEQFSKLVNDEKWHQTFIAPMVRGRLIKINHQEFQKKNDSNSTYFTTREDQNADAMRNRGVNLSYRNKLSWSEKIVEGKFNGDKCIPEKSLCDISLEESYAKRLGVSIGDNLTFNISGLEITGKVNSFRRVKWMSFEPNFFILFQPGILEDAPKTYLSSFKVNDLNKKRQVFTKIAEHFSNVSVLDTTEVIKKITVIFDLMATAVKFISFLSLFAALVVLIAVSFNHLELRKKDMALYNMLGLKKNFIKKIYIREFSFLIIICIGLSITLGTFLTKILMNYIFDSDIFMRLPLISIIMTAIGLILYYIVTLRLRYLMNKLRFNIF